MRKDSIIFFFSFLYFCACNTIPDKKENGATAVSPLTGEQILLDSLSEAMYSYDKNTIQKYWDTILDNKDAVISYLISFKGKKNISTWHWRDLKSSRIFARNYSKPSEEVAALFLICAINYNDLYFAASRNLYNSEVLRIDNNGNFINIDECQSDINIDFLWQNVFEWNINKQGRPFKESKIFWVGEPGGKINRVNIVKTKWNFYR